MKYTTYRYWFKYGNEDDPIECTTKEWDNLDKAITYAHRYATGVKFDSVEIEDENGKVIYRITSDSLVEDFRNEKLEEVLPTELKEIDTLKIKKIGKNKVSFKKLIADKETIIKNNKGFDSKWLFEKLIGYDFITEKLKDGTLKVTDQIGESFFITTKLEIEIT